MTTQKDFAAVFNVTPILQSNFTDVFNVTPIVQTDFAVRFNVTPIVQKDFVAVYTNQHDPAAYILINVFSPATTNSWYSNNGGNY